MNQKTRTPSQPQQTKQTQPKAATAHLGSRPLSTCLRCTTPSPEPLPITCSAGADSSRETAAQQQQQQQQSSNSSSRAAAQQKQRRHLPVEPTRRERLEMGETWERETRSLGRSPNGNASAAQRFLAALAVNANSNRGAAPCVLPPTALFLRNPLGGNIHSATLCECA